MADIGSTLRETRIRDKIDITVVEEATKIRAKYLRALENEEWAVLPGPTYVKSFLRTYAEFLGLDAHMIVEEYRARYEQPEDLEVPAFTQTGPVRSRVKAPGPPSRGVAITALGVGLLVVLFILGITGGDENDGGDSGSSDSKARSARTTERGGQSKPAQSGGAAPAPVRKNVSLTLVATRPVWVCLVDTRGRLLVEGRTVAGGETEGPFRSKRFIVTVGNGGADLRINGKLRDLPDRAVPQGYAVSSAGVKRLTPERAPTCEPGASERAQRPGAVAGTRTAVL
jgi:cytoskeleton protein RodZ